MALYSGDLIAVTLYFFVPLYAADPVGDADSGLYAFRGDDERTVAVPHGLSGCAGIGHAASLFRDAVGGTRSDGSLPLLLVVTLLFAHSLWRFMLPRQSAQYFHYDRTVSDGNAFRSDYRLYFQFHPQRASAEPYFKFPGAGQ